MSKILTPKQRVRKTLNLQEPDRVPAYITVTPQVAEQLSRYQGIESYTEADSPLSANRISFTELLVPLGNDVVGIGACSPTAAPTEEIEPGVFIDEWQVRYRRSSYYVEMVGHPLAHAETPLEIEQFSFPDPQAAGRFDLAKETVERYGEEYAVCGDLECTIFESAWHLTGFEKLLIDMALEKEYVFTLMECIMGYSIGVGRELIRLGADFLWLGDDVGTQRGMLISPEIWRKVLKPRMRRVIEELRAENPEIKFAYHCCGSYYPIIPDLLEIGVDVLNALQPKATDMDLARIKKRFGDRACLFGGLDIQEVLPFGTLQAVEREVKRVLSAAAPGGGYILAGAHNIQPDTSSEKVETVFRVAEQYGRYDR
jgi:uroporphyrinogen decarboxylase